MTEDEERRRYFRIEDEVAISFTLLEDENNGEHEDNLNQEFHMSLEVQIRHAMAEIRSQSPKVAQVLDLMNQKINLLRSLEDKDGSAPILKGANLSACGVAFAWHEPLPINQQLMVNLYLQPNHELIRTQAHVAGVTKMMPQMLIAKIHKSFGWILIIFKKLSRGFDPACGSEAGLSAS